jgi:hypothetical protein
MLLKSRSNCCPVHVLEEENVLPSRSFSIVEIIEQVEREIGL